MVKGMQKVCHDITFNNEKFKKMVATNIYASGMMTGDTFSSWCGGRVS